MLVLSRKKFESIMVGEVEISVVEIRGDKVRLGIEAPDNVPVHRREIYEKIQRQRERKAQDAAAELGSIDQESA